MQSTQVKIVDNEHISIGLRNYHNHYKLNFDKYI